GRRRLIRNQVWAQVQRGFDSHPLLELTREDNRKKRSRRGRTGFARPTSSREGLGTLPGFPSQSERCPSGRRGTIGNRVYRKVPRVRIPLSPPVGVRGVPPGASLVACRSSNP